MLDFLNGWACTIEERLVKEKRTSAQPKKEVPKIGEGIAFAKHCLFDLYIDAPYLS